jgi:hypothetical protein
MHGQKSIKLTNYCYTHINVLDLNCCMRLEALEALTMNWKREGSLSSQQLRLLQTHGLHPQGSASLGA